MKRPVSAICRYVLEKSATDTVVVRAKAYRDLAEIIGDESLAQKLSAMANDLERVDAQHRHLLVNLDEGRKP